MQHILLSFPAASLLTFMMRAVSSRVGIMASASPATALQVAFSGMPSVWSIVRPPSGAAAAAPCARGARAPPLPPLSCSRVSTAVGFSVTVSTCEAALRESIVSCCGVSKATLQLHARDRAKATRKPRFQGSRS